VYKRQVIAHTKTDKDGQSVLHTPGKLLEDAIKIPSYFTYVLHSNVEEGEDGLPRYYFLTNRIGDGKEAKSPEECLETKEENDYKAIIDKIEAYHNG
jgi:hypothetical protein